MAARFIGAGMVGWEEVGNHRGKLCGVSFWEREGGISKHKNWMENQDIYHRKEQNKQHLQFQGKWRDVTSQGHRTLGHN